MRLGNAEAMWVTGGAEAVAPAAKEAPEPWLPRKDAATGLKRRFGSSARFPA